MLGIDIGTTSTKAVLYNQTGNVLQQAAQEYPLYTPNINVAEQDPEEIYQAVITVIRQITNQHNDLMFVSFSSAMHSLIAIDDKDEAITPCIIWADNRSKAWATDILQHHDGLNLYQRTGTPIHPMSPLCKISWLRHEQPDIFLKADKFIGIKEFVFKRFFNQYVVDHSIASATGLMNLKNLDWDQQALTVAGIEKDNLSTLVPTTAVFTQLKQQVANQLNLDCNTPFIIGASDGVLSNLGVDAIGSGDIAVTIGTSGAVRTTLTEPRTDSAGRTFCYALTEHHWVVGGPVNNGGVVLQWIKDQLCTSEVAEAKRTATDPYDLIMQLAESVAPGSNGLIFHPFLTGERAPSWNPDVRGSYFGLTLAHKRAHLIRAALEGVILNLFTVYQALTEMMETKATMIRATGGFARSPLWRQMLADIFAVEVTVPESHESSCLGACILGLYALGEITSLEESSAFFGHSHHHQPDEKAKQVYQQLAPIYSSITADLKTNYQRIADFQAANE